jgi:hypothetical protein
MKAKALASLVTVDLHISSVNEMGSLCMYCRKAFEENQVSLACVLRDLKEGDN